jgi:hypothetical protein
MGQAEVELLHKASHGVLEKGGEIVGEIVGEVFRDPEAARVFQEAGLTRDALEEMLRGWLVAAFQGDYGEKMCLEVSKIGLMLAAHGLSPGFVLAKLATVTEVISRHVAANEVFPVVLKALRWNLTVVMLGYEVVRQRIFERATGISEDVYNRLIKVYAKELVQEISQELR